MLRFGAYVGFAAMIGYTGRHYYRHVVGGMLGLRRRVSNATIGRRTDGRFRDTRDLVAAYQAGDVEATRLWRRTTWCLACGIASIINAVDPERVVIGGGIANAGEALFTPLRKDLEQVEWRPDGASVEVVPAQLGDLAGSIGAARAAMDGVDVMNAKEGRS